MKKEIERDFLTGRLLAKASPRPALPTDFTEQVLAQIAAETAAQREKIHEPLLPIRVWRWLGITLSSMVLLTLSLSVLAFGAGPNFKLAPLFAHNLSNALFFNQFNYLPELFLAGVICFCWLVVDDLYSRLRRS